MKTEGSQYYYIPSKGASERLDTLEQALQARNRKGYIWIDLYKPDKEILTSLMQPLDLHHLPIEDCLDENQIPKLEEYNSNDFLIFNSFHYQGRELAIAELDVFISDRYLVTVRQAYGESGEFYRVLEPYLSGSSPGIQEGPAFLLHILLDGVVDRKFDAIEALEDGLNEAEEAILADLPNFNPAELLHLRQELLAARKSLFHEREILGKICRLDSRYIGRKALFFYRDLYDHLSRFFELSEATRDLVTSLMEMYLSMLNNQMARSSNEMNATIRRLTYITTIFMPLTLLAGIGGMSEYTMMTGAENWKLSYPAFLVGMLVLGLINYFIIKRWERQRSIRGD